MSQDDSLVVKRFLADHLKDLELNASSDRLLVTIGEWRTVLESIRSINYVVFVYDDYEDIIPRVCFLDSARLPIPRTAIDADSLVSLIVQHHFHSKPGNPEAYRLTTTDACRLVEYSSDERLIDVYDNKEVHLRDEEHLKRILCKLLQDNQAERVVFPAPIGMFPKRKGSASHASPPSLAGGKHSTPHTR